MDKIIEIIKEDSRATPKDIAVMLGMTEEEVVSKIKKLEDDNIILKYTILILISIIKPTWKKQIIYYFI